MRQFIKKVGSNELILFSIIVIGGFLRAYKLPQLMGFIGDQGWFYWSAKKLLIDHQIPLVGIASSHPWIHQGAVWTYILTILFSISNFNPYLPAFFTAILGTITILLIYFVSKEFFDKKVGILAAFIYATSPLVISEARFAYHTSPIPTVVLIFIFFIYRWLKGDKRFFPICMFLVGLIYNFEIATFSLIGTFGLILLFGFFKKKKWARGLLNRKTVYLSLIGFLLPMSPMIAYDLNHGFPQTLKFAVWIVYRVAVLFGFRIHKEIGGEAWHTFAIYNLDVLRHLVFLPSGLISLFIILALFVTFIFVNYGKLRKSNFKLNSTLIFIFVLFPTVAFLSQRTNSGAYLSMLFPQWIILIAFVLAYWMQKRLAIVVVSVIIVLIAFFNSYIMIKSDYFATTTMNDKIAISRRIIKEANGRPYNLVGRGNGSQYESFVTPYKYLTWYLGNPASEKEVSLKFYLTELPDRIVLETK